MNESGRRISTILLVLQSFVIHRIASTDTMAAFTSHHITRKASDIQLKNLYRIFKYSSRSEHCNTLG
jgi:hypothetical protein